MSEQNFKTVVCPECGAELQIPQQLTEYSCMYCGARLSDSVPQPLDEASAEELEAVYAALISCVTGYPDYNQKITRDLYAPSFDTYRAGCAPVFERLNAAARTDEQVAAAADRLLDDLAAAWDGEKSKTARQHRMTDDKIIVAIFLVPMVRTMELPVSEPFCKALQEKWCERYPKDPFYLGTYDAIAGGFRKKFLGLCFITTAVCQSRGLPDDCAELTAFRAFRDGYLRTCPDGAALIDEYYNIAPGIVACIDICGDRDARYDAIRADYLDPCYRDLQAGKLEDCKNRYVRMVRALEKEYLS